MATFDLVLLSSSPPASSGAARHRRTTPPSNQQQRVPLSAFSPLSPTARRTGMPRASGALKSGSRAAPVPDGALPGFATASSLVRSHHFTLENEDEHTTVQEAQPLRKPSGDREEDYQPPKKPRKRPTKTKDAVEGGDPKPKKTTRARKPKAGKEGDANHAGSRAAAPTTSSHFAVADTANLDEPMVEDQAPVTTKAKPRKPRAKKEQAADTEVKDAGKKKTTKAKATPKPTSKPRKRAKDTAPGNAGERVAHTDDPMDGVESTTEHTTLLDDQSNLLADGPRQEQGSERYEAIVRRRSWTPVRDTHIAEPSDQAEPDATDTAPAQKGNFTSMLSTFAFEDNGPKPSTTATTTTKPAKQTKRRRSELVDGPGNQPTSRDPSPEKAKGKKKARTITDLVTEQYAQKDTTTTSPTNKFFDARERTTKIPLNDVSNTKPAAKSTRKRSNSKTAKKDSTSAKATAKAAAQVKIMANKLLSPASAMSKLQRQDVLFGTSSQLALEESPRMVRQLQQAIRESEQDAMLLPGLASKGQGLMARLQRRVGNRGLWGASARDGDGHLLEKQDDVYIPEPDRTEDLPLLMDNTIDECDEPDIAAHNEELQQPEREIIQISSDLPTPPPKEIVMKDQQHDSGLEDTSLEILDESLPLPLPTRPSHDDLPDIDDIPPSTQPLRLELLSSEPSEPPDASMLFTPLSPIVSPRKRRGRPPKVHSAFPPVQSPFRPNKTRPAEKSADIAPPSTPPKSTGRFSNIEEILDSEDDEALSPTPPRKSKLADSPPLSLVPSMPPLKPTKTPKAPKAPRSKPDPNIPVIPVFLVPLAHLEWNIIKASIFKKITPAITSLPPTTDPSKPSWYEKILLYDPIIIEDLTAFINTSTPIRTWKRATQKQIKAYNKRQKLNEEPLLVVEDEEDEVLVVEKELEPFMVQAWCEEMSVCCIPKESRWNRGARKNVY